MCFVCLTKLLGINRFSSKHLPVFNKWDKCTSHQICCNSSPFFVFCNFFFSVGCLALVLMNRFVNTWKTQYETHRPFIQRLSHSLKFHFIKKLNNDRGKKKEVKRNIAERGRERKRDGSRVSLRWNNVSTFCHFRCQLSWVENICY